MPWIQQVDTTLQTRHCTWKVVLIAVRRDTNHWANRRLSRFYFQREIYPRSLLGSTFAFRSNSCIRALRLRTVRLLYVLNSRLCGKVLIENTRELSELSNFLLFGTTFDRMTEIDY